MIIATSWYANEVVHEYSRYAISRMDGSVRVFGRSLYVAWVSIIPHALAITILCRKVCSCENMMDYEDVGSGRSSGKTYVPSNFYNEPRQNSAVWTTQRAQGRAASGDVAHFVSKKAKILGNTQHEFV